MSKVKPLVLFISVFLLFGFVGCEQGGEEASAGGKEEGKNAESVSFDSENAIGVGWITYDKPYTGTTTATINLRSKPTVNGEVVKVVEEGTEIKRSSDGSIKVYRLSMADG